MIRKFLLASVFLACAGVCAKATPVTIKELDLMVRMGVSDTEILQSLESRHLLTPLDAAAEKQLAADGAKAALVSKIKAGNYVVSADDAAKIERQAAEQRLLIAQQNSADELALLQRQAPPPQQAPQSGISDKMRRFLDGKLVRVAFGQVMAYSADELKNVRFFAIYEGSSAAACHAFTQRLAGYYGKTKPEHPEFEIIYVSEDTSAETMEKTLIAENMPWPAVRFDSLPAMRPFTVKAIPWMGLFNSAAIPFFPMNPQDKTMLVRDVSPVESVKVLDDLVHGRNPGPTGPATPKPAAP